MDKYQLLDSGGLQKLEQFGPIRLVRPCPFAVWSKGQDSSLWSGADALFSRDNDNRWHKTRPQLSSWQMEHGSLSFTLSLGDCGNIGLFPEHENHWSFIDRSLSLGVQSRREQIFVLNLFAYTGGASLVSAKAGACTCHVDASKPSVAWARENAKRNELLDLPIRWIVDDALEFVRRELRRGRKYDAIILDPPTFGRGPRGQPFKIEKDLPELLKLCVDLLSENPLFILLTCHTPGFTQIVLRHIMEQQIGKKRGLLEAGEMLLHSGSSFDLPSGSFARWTHEGIA